jgi:uncharacterized protein
MKEALSKKVLSYALSLFLLVATVQLVLMALSPSWHENLKAQVFSEPMSKSITISAEGKITANPDIAMVNLAVVSQSKNVKDAVKDGNEKMKKIYDAMKSISVEEKDIKSTRYNLYPNYDYSKSYSSPRITGYSLNQEFQIKIRDLDNIENVLDKGVEAGANQIGQLSFDIDNPAELKKEARKKAFETAKEKAKEMADSAGVQLGEIITFNEYEDSYLPAYPNYRMESSIAYDEAVSAPTIAPGTKDFSVSISITYSLK